MITSLGVIAIDNMSVEDIAYSNNYTEYIELKNDIDSAKKKLKIKNICNTYDALKIAESFIVVSNGNISLLSFLSFLHIFVKI